MNDDLIEEKMDYTPLGADVHDALEKHRQWWEPYGHETLAQRADGLGQACSYWHSCWEVAMDELETLRAASSRTQQTETP